ncbi:MAG TPA: NADH-quinone oxidoreductase subunit C [Bryobacteraceae bacterium]|nr:NADH-quinone oxidoreductase subunit C [Bryobacteraceae bacterium]
MADEDKPDSPAAPPPSGAEAASPGVKPAVPAPKPAAAKPTAAAHAAPPKPPAVMVTTPWEGPVCDALKDRFDSGITELSTYLGQNFLVAKPDAVIPILETLKLELDFDYLVDVTAVDYPKRAERFDLVYVLYSFARNERIRVKTMIPDGYRPASAVGVHLAANWLEREVFDMFGIQFAGHPDMRRILLPEEWQGYPLRKEHSILQQDDGWVRENLGIESGH